MGAGRVDQPVADAVAEGQLRVTQVVLSDGFAGTESHVALLSRHLHTLGVRVRLVCGDRNTRLRDEVAGSGVDVRAVRLASGNLPADWASASRDIVGWGPHLVHAHLGSSLLCSTALTLAGKQPLVFTQHFIKPAYREGRGLKAGGRAVAHRLVHKRVAVAVATTRFARAEMIEHEGFTEDQVTVIPLGIDVDRVTTAARQNRGAVHAELGLPYDAALIVTPARLEQEKGHHTLLAAMPAVLEKHPIAYLLLAGEGALRPTLEAGAQRLGIGERVRFLGQRTDVPRLLAHSSLCVLPSYEEPFGLVLLEAMAVGAPVIACGAGGPSEIVVQGATGFLVPPRDSQSMAMAIIAALDNPSQRTLMGAAGQARVATYFNARTMATQTLQAYQLLAIH